VYLNEGLDPATGAGRPDLMHYDLGGRAYPGRAGITEAYRRLGVLPGVKYGTAPEPTKPVARKIEMLGVTKRARCACTSAGYSGKSRRNIAGSIRALDDRLRLQPDSRRDDRGTGRRGGAVSEPLEYDWPPTKRYYSRPPIDVEYTVVRQRPPIGFGWALFIVTIAAIFLMRWLHLAAASLHAKLSGHRF
jgi:hypothetical protein